MSKPSPWFLDFIGLQRLGFRKDRNTDYQNPLWPEGHRPPRGEFSWCFSCPPINSRTTIVSTSVKPSLGSFFLTFVLTCVMSTEPSELGALQRLSDWTEESTTMDDSQDDSSFKPHPVFPSRELPPELLIDILGYLETRDLQHVVLASKLLRDIAQVLMHKHIVICKPYAGKLLVQYDKTLKVKRRTTRLEMILGSGKTRATRQEFQRHAGMVRDTINSSEGLNEVQLISHNDPLLWEALTSSGLRSESAYPLSWTSWLEQVTKSTHRYKSPRNQLS